MKYVWLAFVMLILTASIFWYIGLAKQHPQLEKAIKEAVASKEDSLSLSEYGEWKEMHTFGPYTTNEMIEEKLGRKFRGPSLASDDLNFLLVLVDTKNSVRYALLPRTTEDYIITDYLFNNDEADEIKIEYHPRW